MECYTQKLLYTLYVLFLERTKRTIVVIFPPTPIVFIIGRWIVFNSNLPSCLRMEYVNYVRKDTLQTPGVAAVSYPLWTSRSWTGVVRHLPWTPTRTRTWSGFLTGSPSGSGAASGTHPVAWSQTPAPVDGEDRDGQSSHYDSTFRLFSFRTKFVLQFWSYFVNNRKLPR